MASERSSKRFPGATADSEAADYALVGTPLDVSTSFRPGTRFGPDAIRSAAVQFEDYDQHTDSRLSTLGVHDRGDIHAWDDIPEYLAYVNDELGAFYGDGTIPVLLGGEHTVSLAGVRTTQPDVFVSIDAHLDLRERYSGRELCHATVTHHALSVADRAVIIGARSGSEAEWDRAADGDVTVVAPEDAADWTPDFADESVYCSVDIDAVEPAAAPATGTLAPFGLEPRTVRDLVTDIAPHATGFDVVEVNDRDQGQTAALAARLARTYIHAHATADDAAAPAATEDPDVEPEQESE
jgi:agmatinase